MEPLGSSVLDEEPMVLGEYQLLQRLGEGSYGAVFLAENMKTKRKYAIKEIPVNAEERVRAEALVRHEAQIMQSLHHPHVVQFYQLLATKDSFYFVMELAEGGELFDRIIASRCFTENTARKYFQQLMSAIFYCHTNTIAHRDLKVENLLVDRQGNLKVCDFSVSTAKVEDGDEDTVWRQTAGTTHYMCPELFIGEDEDQVTVDPFKSDLYAAGVILYFMLVGELPFEGADDEEVMYLITRGDYDSSLLPSRGARALVTSLLEVNPKARATMEDVLADPWFLCYLDPNLFPSSDVPLELIRSSHRDFLNFARTPRSPCGIAELSDDELILLRKAFDNIDTDHYGDHVTKDEIRDCLISLNRGKVVTADEVERLIQIFHPAKSDWITFEEFKRAWVDDDLAHNTDNQLFQLPAIAALGHATTTRSLMRLLRASFDRLDGTHTGVFTKKNLVDLFESARINVPDTEVVKLIESLSCINHKENVTFDEFVHAIAKHEVLVKHPLGKRLASALNLMKVVHLGEIAELVGGGITVSGTPEDVLVILQTRAHRLAHVARSVNGYTRIPSDIFEILPPAAFGHSSPLGTTSTVSPPRFPNSSFRGGGGSFRGGANGSQETGSSSADEWHTFQYSRNSAPPSPNTPHDEALGSVTSIDSTSTYRSQVVGQGLRRADGTQLEISPQVLSTPNKPCTPHQCVVDVHLIAAACIGYTTVKLRRISGATKEFHHAAHHIANAIGPEREQALLDSSPVDEGELM